MSKFLDILQDGIDSADNLIGEDGIKTDNEVNVEFTKSSFIFLGLLFAVLLLLIMFYFLFKKYISNEE